MTPTGVGCTLVSMTTTPTPRYIFQVSESVKAEVRRLEGQRA